VYLKKNLKNIAQYYVSNLIGGRKNTSDWEFEKYGLKTEVIQNKQLALELENACQKDGYLLFSEFLQIDQHGKYGYHLNNKWHGEQQLYRYWGKAIAKLCQYEPIERVLDFGAGNGDLGIAVIDEARKLHYKIIWSGIEINGNLISTIRQAFKRKKYEENLLQISPSINKILSSSKKSLLVFSYSLDNLAPEMFINENQDLHYPTNLMGVTVKNGVVNEIILTNEQLLKKKIQYKNGVLSQNGTSYNLHGWKLTHLQRACIPITAAKILLQSSKKVKQNSMLLIIDEFSEPNYARNEKHLNFPKDLTVFDRIFKNTTKLYNQAGNNLLYYPTYLLAYESILQSLGYTQLQIDNERTLANILAKKHIIQNIPGLCFGILAKKTSKTVNPITIKAY
jgi:hypothetical protein